jgi:cytochrome c biogenesis protein
MDNKAQPLEPQKEQNTAQTPEMAPTSNKFIAFLGSMNLAITLLVMLAIASVIGTVLKQNEAYSSYVIKFGPFWFDVFRQLELYDVYSAIWFLSVLAFLLASISACVWRNGRFFIQDMLSFQSEQSPEKLAQLTHHQQWVSNHTAEHNLQLAQPILQQAGFRLKTETQAHGQVIAGKKGLWHRMGYFFTHIAIVIICLGALLDSNLKFKIGEWFGAVEAETRNLAVKDVNPKAMVSADNFAFRGSVNIPEGKRADMVFLPFKEGYLVQKLPFQVEVIDFRVQHYDTGMPKSFESDIILLAPDQEPIKATLSVNKPLIYKDYAIYQSSFGDGGSEIQLQAWPLQAQNNTPSSLSGQVHDDITINTPIGDYRIELNDYKTNNVIPLPENDPSGRKNKNLGPSVQFKLRDSAGQAVEYENYLTAIDRAGHWYQVSKYRHSMAEPFEFLMLPLDDKQSMASFMKFLSLVNNRKILDQVLDAEIQKTQDSAQKEQLMTQKAFMQQLINLFRARGFAGIEGYIRQAVAPDKQEETLQRYIEILTIALQSVYLHQLSPDNQSTGISEEQRRFFADSVEAISQLADYGPPMFFEVTQVTPRESSGLQITKSPGKDVVYFGSFLLIMGVFLLFYVRPQRIWLWTSTNEQGHTLMMISAKDVKNDALLADQFTQITQALQSAIPPIKE